MWKQLEMQDRFIYPARLVCFSHIILSVVI